MKKLTITLITIISLCGLNYSPAAERYVTLIGNGSGVSQAIGANEMAYIILLLRPIASGNQITVTKGGTSIAPGTGNGK